MTYQLVFRFVLCFLLFRLLPFPAGALPGTAWLADAWNFVVESAVAVTGNLIVGQAPANVRTGSSDRYFDYVRLLVQATAALLLTLVWTMHAAQTASVRQQAEDIASLYVRYTLAAKLFMYGSAKVWPIQFPPLGAFTLSQTYGESSPMRLLWTFMAYSRPYATFCGMVEIAGALLLLSNRTALVGALLLTGGLANVVMLNFCYDVPVKLDALTYLVASLFVLTPHWRRLYALLLPLSETAALDGPSARRQARKALGIISVALMLFAGLAEMLEEVLHRERNEAIAGFYTATTLPRDHDIEVLEVTSQVVYVRLASGSRMKYVIHRYDEGSGTVQLVERRDGQVLRHEMQVKFPSSDLLHVDLDGDVALLRRVPPPTFPLLTRGFHWINEAAYNR